MLSNVPAIDELQTISSPDSYSFHTFRAKSVLKAFSMAE